MQLNDEDSDDEDSDEDEDEDESVEMSDNGSEGSSKWTIEMIVNTCKTLLATKKESTITEATEQLIKGLKSLGWSYNDCTSWTDKWWKHEHCLLAPYAAEDGEICICHFVF
jgi:hypothetical protein